MRLLISVLVAAALAACASSGTKFDIANVDTMRPGETTEQEAVAKMGKPNSTAYAKDGSKMMIWSFAEVRLGKTTTGSVSLIFDKNGKFVRTTSKSSTN